MAVLLFDGDCGFCSSCADWARRRLPEDVTVVPWQLADLEHLGVTEQEARAAVQWLGPDSRASGAAAVSETLVAIGRPWSLIGHFCRGRLTRTLAELTYRLIAKYRHRLPGGTPACQLRGTPPR